MKKQFLYLHVLSLSLSACNPVKPGAFSALRLQKTFAIASDGWWDYLALEPGRPRLFVSHGTQINVLDARSGDSIGVVKNTQGVHGIAFAPGLQKGFSSNGRTNDVSVFDLNTFAETARLPTGENPDFILYESFSGKVITCNGGSHDLTLFDPVTGKIAATIALGGKPEAAVSDGRGSLFVNLEDKNEVVRVNLKTFSVEKHWSLAPAEAPTGLAFDSQTKRLFVGCDDWLVVLDSDNGSVISRIPIGAGCDGVAFDASTQTVFTSNGEAGTMSVVREYNAARFKKIAEVSTQVSARTCALDPSTHWVYLPAADFEAQKPGETGRPKMKPRSFRVLVFSQN